MSSAGERDVFARPEQAALGHVQHEFAEPKYWKLPHQSAAAGPPSFRQRSVSVSSRHRIRRSG